MAARPDWTSNIQVEEKQLQAYLCQKQHTLVLKGATLNLKHTLEDAPTTDMDDGCVHFGDSLLLQNACTQGLLQTDPVAEIPVDFRRTDVTGLSLSSGSTLSSCHRSVFTVSRVDDHDGFSTETFVHYGQIIRLGIGAPLHERDHYLWHSINTRGSEADGDENKEADGHSQVCLYPRAAKGSHWRVVRSDRVLKGRRQSDFYKQRVQLGDPIRLVSVEHEVDLQSDGVIIMTSYGNEYRVFGATGEGLQVAKGQKPPNEWLFMNSRMTEGIMEEAKLKDGDRVHALALQTPASPNKSRQKRHVDAAHRLRDPLYRAETDLLNLDELGQGATRYAVLARVYPLLQGQGMHTVRKLRRMCLTSDIEGKGIMRMRTFQGLLSWVSIRLSDAELQQLETLFGCNKDGKQLGTGAATPATGEGERESLIDYSRFFLLMGHSLPNLRREAIEDAYKKLQAHAISGVVEIAHLQRYWRPRSHPQVQSGEIMESEAWEDFLKQWDIAHADGLVSWQEFLDYYRDVSLAVKDDELFVELVRKAWDL
mmetsp:Transcript_63506/g.112967  ORF Transcript_63506/g.112967 Transcript_63506/m.112967 type:complete len:537 (+) Transcript_63506:54-1664(+)|eukprot:CAMPEP_0197628596 /NCGR_PEP_ID=MMETSP1338-20131121/6834_1 /TAXON_ID=43686 ORGANISM="Pelagodinium beii, Strain RCC1491" /NCGR_SAMPLE_ID=MMETSP1338 /ASSEMBLY_ACC=CAM_ASM_000754 /LENGTH=536 /DNA_ID=CAMNT_0043199581 /DNA_START=33 /DNA_END=1643 /DNA_ORIENTATION=+